MKSTYTHKNIITLPNDHLRQRSQKITTIDDNVKQVISDMIAASLDWEQTRPNEVAVALAAVQIDKNLRIIIIREDFDDKENRSFLTLINPEIVKYEGQVVTDFEGCLSVKDVYGKVPRYSQVRCRAIDINGNPVKFKAKDAFTARVLQHEVDHTKGICFVDHIADQPKAFYLLANNGELEPCSYDKVKQLNILPEIEDQ